MSGKQAKKSRRIQRDINTHLDKVRKELTAQKEVKITEIIALYNIELYKMSFLRRAKFCYKVLQCGNYSLTLRELLLLSLLLLLVLAWRLVLL